LRINRLYTSPYLTPRAELEVQVSAEGAWLADATDDLPSRTVRPPVAMEDM
jgi:hypothetical protein